MRINRDGENRSGKKKLLNWQIYIRKNFGIVMATEWFYQYIGENSYMPFCDLILDEDAKILKEAIEDLQEPVEVYTKITNYREPGYRHIYLRMENSDKTEDGEPLYLVTMLDMLDMESRVEEVEHSVAKYRHFMALRNEYFFEYTLSDNKLVIYKYANHRSITVIKSDLDEFVANYTRQGADEEQMQMFSAYLKSRTHSFDMNFTISNEDGISLCGVRGGTYYQNQDLVSGMLSPEHAVASQVYYLTPAARDAGTGLLNKKAATEYAIDRMHLAGEKTCWIIVMDIDDFKNINDSFGHLFGDKVIRTVGDTLQECVGNRGVTGRFGGDEFFVMLDRVYTREDLKTTLKTITKKLAYAYDPKLKIQVSIGVSQYPKDGTNFSELFGKADKALYIAKEKGKNRHIIYDPAMHGEYTNDSIQNQAVEYAVSKDKRRKTLVQIINNIYKNGVEYVTKSPEVQQEIRGLFDLDGFTVYTNRGSEVLFRNGIYVCEAPDTNGELMDETYLELFGEDDMLELSSTIRMKTQHPEFYQSIRKQELGATLRCIARKDGVPYAMIHFDVFNRNRKWSDVDIEMLGMLGSCLGGLICEL